jgi:Membrane-bound lysozyme-inhibitor of c-type lysozyme
MLAGGPVSAQAQKTFVYQCEDGTRLTTTFPRFRFARLELDGRTVVLTRRISASGSRYSKRRVSSPDQGPRGNVGARAALDHMPNGLKLPISGRPAIGSKRTKRLFHEPSCRFHASRRFAVLIRVISHGVPQ